MSIITFDFQPLDRLDQYLHYLLLGQHHYVISALQSLPISDPVALWLRMYLRQDIPEEIRDSLPPHYISQWRGWRAYYCGEYLLAADCFSQAWDALYEAAIPRGQADVALGLGKVYTRTGHWRAARAWLLLSMALARRQNRLFDIVQGYGALGELLLRAGHAQAAYTCLSNAYHLLPPGSGQRPRQLNYLASALMRCGETLRAESLLMTSLHLAHDSEDYDSVWHALARLQFLHLDVSLINNKPAEDITEVLSEYVPKSENTPVALGFLRMGQAWLAYRQGNQALALSKISIAKQSFGQQFPCEHRWTFLWETLVSDKTMEIEPGLLDVIALNPALPPQFQAVLDSSWQRLDLPEQNGFTSLSQASFSMESLLACRYLFFI